MSLSLFDSYLSFAENALKHQSRFPPEIDAVELESSLVGYGVVLLHSQMEQCLKQAVRTRCQRCQDHRILKYALSVVEEKSGRLAIGELNRTLNRFGDDCKADFQQRLTATSFNSGWDAIVGHRGTIAHLGQPAQLSLADLRLYYEQVRGVLSHFCVGLELTDPEITSISPLIPLRASR